MSLRKIFFAFLSFSLLISCSGDGDDTINPSPSEGISSIQLSASANEVDVDGTVTFTVKGNNGSTITSQSIIKVNGESISGSSYSPSEVGNITAQATYNNLLSNSLVIGVKEKPVSGINVASDNDWVTLNDEFTFKISDSNGNDVSDEAELYVNSTKIEGTKFQPNSYGNYEVYAKYESFQSPSINLEAKEKASSHSQKVLIEDFTGTWCGWCPRVSYGLEKVLETTDKAIITAIHRGNDPYHFDGANIGSLDDNRYPTAKLNRKTVWTAPEPQNVAQVTNLTGDDSNLGLAIKSAMTGNSIDLEVRMSFLTGYSNLKYVIYVVEDNLFFNQTNYTEYYGGTAQIADFEHDNVLRQVVTPINGEAIPTETQVANGEYIANYTLTVPTNAENPDNLKFIAFILNNTGVVLNAHEAQVNSFRNYN